MVTLVSKIFIAKRATAAFVGKRKKNCNLLLSVSDMRGKFFSTEGGMHMSL